MIAAEVTTTCSFYCTIAIGNSENLDLEIFVLQGYQL